MMMAVLKIKHFVISIISLFLDTFNMISHNREEE